MCSIWRDYIYYYLYNIKRFMCLRVALNLLVLKILEIYIYIFIYLYIYIYICVPIGENLNVVFFFLFIILLCLSFIRHLSDVTLYQFFLLFRFLLFRFVAPSCRSLLINIVSLHCDDVNSPGGVVSFKYINFLNWRGPS